LGTPCAHTGEELAFLDELYNDQGEKSHVINDSNYLDKLQAGEVVFQHINPYLTQIKDERNANR